MRDESDLSYEGWRVAGAASVGVFVSFSSLFVYTFGTLLKPLAEEFSWSREAVSAAFGIAAMTVAACSPPLGMLLDRHGARRIIVPALAIFGGAFASLALLTPHLWHLYAVCVVIGIVGNATAQMAYTRAVSSWLAAVFVSLGAPPLRGSHSRSTPTAADSLVLRTSLLLARASHVAGTRPPSISLAGAVRPRASEPGARPHGPLDGTDPRVGPYAGA